MLLREALSNLVLVNLVRQNSHDVSAACSLWTTKVIDTINQFIPKVKVKYHNGPPWIDGEVIRLSKCKETSRVTAHRKNTPNAWALYRRFRNRLRTLVNNKYNQYICTSFNPLSNNPKQFWS